MITTTDGTRSCCKDWDSKRPASHPGIKLQLCDDLLEFLNA